MNIAGNDCDCLDMVEHYLCLELLPIHSTHLSSAGKDWLQTFRIWEVILGRCRGFLSQMVLKVQLRRRYSGLRCDAMEKERGRESLNGSTWHVAEFDRR